MAFERAINVELFYVRERHYPQGSVIGSAIERELLSRFRRCCGPKR